MNNIILPIQKNTTLKMECWTYYKLAIIETLPNCMNWLSSHINTFVSVQEQYVFYGNYPKPHPIEYFKDILIIKELDLYEIAPSEIIKQIKETINDNNYFVVFLRKSENQYHEAFIYGYNDINKYFHSFSIKNHSFADTTLTYDEVLCGYSQNIEFYKKYPNLYYSYKNFSPIMAKIQPCYDYINKNYAYEFFDKINNEVYGKKIITTENYAINDFTSPQTYYVGISCVTHARDILNELFKISTYHININEEKLRIIRYNLFKLLEHKKLLHNSMIWYENKWNISNQRIKALRENYNKHCADMTDICNMFLKYTYTQSLTLLKKIIKKIEHQYQNEKTTLGEYALLIRDWYLTEVLQNKL